MDEPRLLTDIRGMLPAMAARASALDAAAAFPEADIAALAACGALLAPLPQSAGGLGFGTEPRGATGLLRLLRMLGQGNLAVGRVYEAHVNALRLISRYGAAADLAAAANDIAEGCLYGLWVTDPPDRGLTLQQDGSLTGRKQFCSGAGHVRRAVVTAQRGADTMLVVATLGHGVAVAPLAGGLQGMRAASTGQVSFEDVPAAAFGHPGDYLREPDFSAGAWRTSAVTLGGLDALLAEAVKQLQGRSRLGDPHQQARMGEALIAGETARLWMAAAAKRAEAADDDPAGAVAYVNFARLAVERACLDAIILVQRSLGVAAFMRQNPVERICRDLSTYLRQPAPDMVLTEAAAQVMGQ